MDDKPESSLEWERKLQQAFDSLRERRSKEKTDQVERGAEWVESLIETLPDDQQEEIRLYDRELEADGIVDPAKRAKHVEKRVAEVSLYWQDKRFTFEDGKGIARLDYGKKKTVDWMREVLDSPEGKLEDLKKVALLSFDANGLKTVNDLGTHTNGTTYLKRIAERIRDKDSKAAAWLREQGIKDIIPMAAGEGGDEYGLVIRSEKPIDQKLIDRAIAMYEDEIASVDASDLVDFEDEGVRKTMLGKGVKMQVPAGFKMRASATGGGATLFEGMAQSFENPREEKRLSSDDDITAVLSKTMGGLWDAADTYANDAKTEFKAGLTAATEGSVERFYGEILTLGRKSAEDMVKDERTKKERMKAVHDDLKQGRKAVKEGLWTDEKYEEFERQKEAEMEALTAE
ncbi:MAG: hypothetical protein AAB554_01130 [Patescibacteria group bacterium]